MITVNDLIKASCLSEITTVAGDGGLNRFVKTISIMDAPDSYKWLKGGELILTSAYLFGNDAKVMGLTLTNLIEAGSSALGVKKNRFLQEIPKEIKHIANKHNFPILFIPYRFVWSEVIGAFYELLYNVGENTQNPIREQQIKQIYEIGRTCGAKLLESMTEMFNAPMAIVRDDKTILTDNGLLGVGELKNAVFDLDALDFDVPIRVKKRFFSLFPLPFIYHGQIAPIDSDFHLSAQPQSALLTEVCKRPQTSIHQKEYLGILTQNEAFLNEMQKMFRRFTDLAIIENNIIKDKAQTFQKLARKLLSGDVSDSDLSAAEDFSKNCETAWVCVILIQASNADAVYIKLLNCIHDTRRNSNQKFSLYMACSETKQIAAVVVEYSEKSKVIAPNTKPEFFIEMEEELSGINGAYLASGNFYPDIRDIKTSYDEAEQALNIGRLIWNEKRFFTFSDLSLYVFLSKQDLTQVDFGIFNALIALEKKFAWDVMPAIEMFLEYGNYKKAAEKLFIHENTLRYRIEKIQEALNIDFYDPFIAHTLLALIRIKKISV